jgi:hypothetical protein
VFVYVRHGRNAWRFQTGQFLERTGWDRVDRPGSLSEDLLTEYRRAAGLVETARSAPAVSVA